MEFFGDFITFDKPFPICNHVQCIDSNNIGYVQGVMNDSIPFEAELWKDGEEKTIAVIFPHIETGLEKRNNMNCRKSKADKSNVVDFHSEVVRRDLAAFPVGMVNNGVEENYDVILYYLNMLIEAGIIEFLTNIQNAYVCYFIDVTGNDLVAIYVTIEDETGILAYCPLEFESFFPKI